MWVTAENETIPTVELGTSSGVYTTSAYGISYTYTIEQMCTAPANTTVSFVLSLPSKQAFCVLL